VCSATAGTTFVGLTALKLEQELQPCVDQV
jgi:hypothetical protein